MMHVGFTGTQLGMTDAQARSVYGLLWYREFYAHHGRCVGADADFDTIVKAIKGCRGVILHPCNITSKQAPIDCRYPYDVMRDVKPPLIRNRDIVRESDRLIATPKETQMQRRSGTWTTVRYARDAGKPIAIVLPDGGVLYEGLGWQV